MQKTALILTSILALTACAGKKTEVAASDDVAPEVVVNFDADSAYSYVERQVAFGPRVPNTEAHRRCGEWLASELRRRGADVTEQRADLTAFDGTVLKAVNILGRFNTESPDRLLLLAHWDCRPWADRDPNPDNRKNRWMAQTMVPAVSACFLRSRVSCRRKLREGCRYPFRGCRRLGHGGE